MALKLGWTTGSGLGRKKQGIISSFLHHSNSAAFIILMVHHSVQTGHSWHSCVVDFALGLVNPVLNLPEGLVKFLGKFKLQKNCNQCCPSKICLGYLKDSWASIYEWQAVKPTCFAPCIMFLWLENMNGNFGPIPTTGLQAEACQSSYEDRRAYACRVTTNLYAL